SEGAKEAQREVAKRAVARLDTLVEEGQSARYDQLAIEQLDALNKKMSEDTKGQGPGILRSHLARIGMNVEGASDIQVFESMVDRLTPQQRQGLPGAASDTDVRMFKSALPSL